MKKDYVDYLAGLSMLLAVTAVAENAMRDAAPKRFGHPGTIARKGVTVKPAGPARPVPTKTNAAGKLSAAVYNDDGTLEIPFCLDPTSDDVDRMTIIDVQNDGRTWSYEKSEKALFYRYSTKLDADDYAVIPVNITSTDRLFRFAVSARCQNGYFGEAFEMCAGDKAEPGSLKPIYSSGMIYNEDYKTFEAYFAAPATGVYYVALHMVSPRNCMRFYVKDIAVEQSDKSRLAPAACDAVTVAGAPLGELKANVTFTAPAKRADGTDAAPDEPIAVKVTSAAESKTLNALPGEELQTEITTIHGDNTIEILPSNTNGEGLKTTMTLFTGPDVPAEPEVTAAVSADNMSMVLHMNVSDVGKNGGYVDVSSVRYTLHSYVEEDGMGTWEAMKEIGSVDSYTYTLQEGTEQDVVNIGITAANDEGENKSVVSVSEVLGTPHAIPATETFAGSKFNYKPVVIEAPTEEYLAEYAILDPTDLLEDAVNNSKLSMAGFITDYGATKGQIALPRFSTENVGKATLGLNVYFHELMPETTVELYGVELEPVTIGKFDSTTASRGWHTVRFDIPASMLGRKWVAPTVTSSFAGEDEEEYIIIDKYFLRPVVEHDLAVEAIYGETKLTVAQETVFAAVIENRGENNATLANAAFEVRIGGEAVASKTLDSATLAAGETTEVTFGYTPLTDHIGDVSINLNIKDSDDIEDNNSASLTATVQKGDQQIITDLQGHTDNGDVVLSWSAIGKLAGFQNMEKLSSFTYGKKIGEFTNYDGDGKNVFTISGFSFPGSGYAKAFQVFNYPKSKVEAEAYLPFSGDQYLIAFTPDDEVTPADDYLISPEIAGGTELSFMLNIITGKYGAESVEIMTSSTDNKPESFTALRVVSKNVQGWEKITETLPADARYFALHYTSCNTFGIMIDDIDYIPVTGLPVVSYNVYRNGTLIGERVTDPSFTDSDAPAGRNTYNVAVVVDGEEYPLSNSVTFAVSGISDAVADNAAVRIAARHAAIEVSGLSGESVAVYTPDGRLLASYASANGSISCPVRAGIYIVRCGDVTGKIRVGE